MGGYTKNFDQLLVLLNEAEQTLYRDGHQDLSDAVGEAAARLQNISAHIDATRQAARRAVPGRGYSPLASESKPKPPPGRP